MEFTEQRYRRLAGGASLILGPALVLAGWSIHPSSGGETAEWISDLAAAPTRAALSMVIAAFGVGLSVFAVLSLVHLLRERLPITGDIGGALAVFGSVMIATVIGIGIAEIETVRELGDGTATATLIDAIDNSGANIALYIGAMLMTVGMLTLAVGLYLAQTTPRVLSLTFGLGVIVQAVAMFVTFNVPTAIVGFALAFIGLAGMGIQLITETDEAWEHAPEFQGFRPVTHG